MAKRKHKKQGEQAQIATEVSQQQQRLELRRQISLMKKLPKDFRDITLGTEWEAFADITGRRKEMDDWYHGPVLHLAPLNEHEKMILGSPNKLIAAKELAPIAEYYRKDWDEKLSTWNWISIIQSAEEAKCSWIYLPDEELPVITALNVLFSRFGYNIRAKGQLISEYSGKPVGVVH